MNSYNNTIISADISQIADSLDYSTLSGATLLITGATGMLATYVVYTLAHLKRSKSVDLRVITLGRSRDKMEAKFGELIEQNIVEPLYQDVCSPLQFDGKIDYIIHLAGAANPRSITSDPVGIIKANTLGLLSIMETAKANGSKVLFASTREVYGEVAKGVTRLREENYGAIDPTDSRSCYPESKRIAETICKSYNMQFGVPSAVVRIAHSYGPGMNIESDGRVMSDLVSDVVNHHNIELKSTGEAQRAFCYITDAVEGLFQILLSKFDFEVYNLANEREPISILELSHLLCSTFPDRNLKVTHRQATEQEMAGYAKFERVTLDTTKLESLGWAPKITLKEGVQRTVKSFIR